MYIALLYFVGEKSEVHDWKKMVSNIQSHVSSLNWSYRTDLRSVGIKYINGLAEFIDPHAIKVLSMYLELKIKSVFTVQDKEWD